MPAPRERMTDIKRRPPRKKGLEVMCGTASSMARVASAVRASAPAISSFLLYRSAHTPPEKEMRNWGR